MTWICTGCGERYEADNPPCQECASEEFVEVVDDEPGRVDPGERVEWRCDDCGTTQPRNNSPCNNCGSLQFSAVRSSGEPRTDPEPKGTFTPPKSSETGSQTLYYAGVVLGVVGVATLPFFFFLIALPEAIAKMRGTTTQKYFPSGARENPAVSGSMLVMGWFGNFLILVFVLGVFLLLILLAL